MITVKTITVASENCENCLQHKTADFSDVMPCSLVVYYAKNNGHMSVTFFYVTT
jgi:hypothetical protein